MSTQLKDTYLVEQGGDRRQVFGPYALAEARAQAGKRYVVIQGSGLENGQYLTSDALRIRIRTGSIRLVDGTSLDGI